MTTTERLPAKYGLALTGSDWVGLPLRIGHLPEEGCVESLSSDTDVILVWTGGPSHVTVRYQEPRSHEERQHSFERCSGMIDILPCATLLFSVSWQGKPSSCISVSFPNTCLAALCSHQGVELDPQRGPQFGLVDAHVVDLAQRLRAQAEGLERYGAVYVQSLSLALASYVLARYGSGSPPPPLPQGAALSLAQRGCVEEFVEQELAADFGLVDLAGLVGYSPDHFAKLFKRTFGQSPYQYVLTRRVERAKAMLRDETLSIADIAAACGFSSQGHLSTTFKQHVGISPKAYRRG